MAANRKIYYGEYRLSHWINLLLKQNIKLPPYQRTFVWDEERVQALITTLKNEDFVPPVTIGKFDGINNVENLILDGQQRLTSVFLAYLGLFPKKDKFKEVLNSLANENDDEAEPEESGDNFMEWTLEELTKKGRTKEDILANVDRDLYDEKDWGVDEDFSKHATWVSLILFPILRLQNSRNITRLLFAISINRVKPYCPKKAVNPCISFHTDTTIF